MGLLISAIEKMKACFFGKKLFCLFKDLRLNEEKNNKHTKIKALILIKLE
jgi:hypothetical protein